MSKPSKKELIQARLKITKIQASLQEIEKLFSRFEELKDLSQIEKEIDNI
jgi:hypothetical protein